MESALAAPEVALLGLAALLTSALSAVVGLAGGITLLAVLLLFLDPLVAIPVHGVVQLVANASRFAIQREHVRWSIIWRFAALLLPMGWLGLALAEQLPPAGLRSLIGGFVLTATWAPSVLLFGRSPEHSDPHRRFFLLGGVAGVLNVAIGATGPLIAPFFMGIGLSRFAVIGTMAACQTLGHLAKIIVFGAAGFAFRDHLPALLLMTPLVIAGTWLGSRMLKRVQEVWFTRLYKGVLTLIALRLLLPL